MRCTVTMETLKVIFSSVAPCVPSNVTVVQLCEGNAASVTWKSSPVATSYQLTATGRDGHVASCNTSVNNCTLGNLHCGQTYSLGVAAAGDNCTSRPSTSSFRTGRHVVVFSFFIYKWNSITRILLFFFFFFQEQNSLLVRDCLTGKLFLSLFW